MAEHFFGEGDWPEDFKEDNGMYLHECRSCQKRFTGHKRRCICKICAQAEDSSIEGRAPFLGAPVGAVFNHGRSSVSGALKPAANPNRAELRRLCEDAPQGDFELQTGCSWRRIGMKGDGDILRPVIHQHDGWPDLSAADGMLEFIAGCTPSKVISLLDECDKAEAERDAALAELEACRKDAERLDWLTKKGAEEDPEQGDVRGYIDTAMSQEAPNA